MSQKDQRRNVLVFLCDQLRPDFLHAYGANFIPTPNLDALAAEGVVYDNAITASTVCAPARMSFLTGQHVSGHDAWTNNIPARDGTEYLPERLSAAGYMTAAVGCFDHAPVTADFGYRYLDLCLGDGGRKNDYLTELKAKHPEVTNNYPRDEKGRFAYGEEEFYDTWAANRAVDFIESYTKTGKAPDGSAPDDEGAPFFLYCGFLSPHDPLIPPVEVEGSVDPAALPPIQLPTEREEELPEVERYRRTFLYPREAFTDPASYLPELERQRRLYCELIVEVDRLVGRVVNALKAQGIYENTTIIFTSDHGSVNHDHLVMTKGPWPYRAQLFVPMIIANHPRLAKGTHCDALCGNMDVGATALDIAGDRRAFGLSRSMLGLADGTVEEREVHMSEFCDTSKTIVDKQYTYIYYPFTGMARLYDRVNDPEEKNNLIGDPAYADIERRFLMHTVDLMILSKGIRIEAHDMTPATREGIEKKHPTFLDNFDIAYPIPTRASQQRLFDAGLDGNFNEFCKDRPIKAHYGVYFFDEKK